MIVTRAETEGYRRQEVSKLTIKPNHLLVMSRNKLMEWKYFGDSKKHRHGNERSQEVHRYTKCCCRKKRATRGKKGSESNEKTGKS